MRPSSSGPLRIIWGTKVRSAAAKWVETELVSFSAWLEHHTLEAAVKSAKGLMARSLMNARCTFEELVTITAEVEAILNSRPLTLLSSDPSDLGALTPLNILTGDSLRALPEQENNDEQLKSLDRWRLWTKSTPSISIGDMVLIHEDNIPSQKWIMGRITARFLGEISEFE
ncbi:hypothetical protein ACLKA7_000946 [Drosophila subpalustris]